MKKHTIVLGKSGFIGSSLDINAICPSKKECNLLSYKSTYNFFKNYQFCNINLINLAAKVGGVFFNQSHHVEMLYQNGLMILNLVKVIKELRLNCYFLQIGSVCAYDDTIEANEEQIYYGVPLESNFGYGMAKRLVISVCQSLCYDKLPVRLCILLPTNAYGLYDNFNLKMAHVIPSILYKMLRKEPEILIHGNAHNQRNFIFSKDLCRIIKVYLQNQWEGIYNISSDENISIFDLINMIKRVTNYNGDLKFNYNGIISQRKICNSKFKKLFLQNNKLVQFTDLEKGLRQTYLWMKEYC